MPVVLATDDTETAIAPEAEFGDGSHHLKQTAGLDFLAASKVVSLAWGASRCLCSWVFCAVSCRPGFLLRYPAWWRRRHEVLNSMHSRARRYASSSVANRGQ